jgi:hypothetical protein
MTASPVWIIARIEMAYGGRVYRAGDWLRVAPIDAAVLTYSASGRRKVADLAPRGATPPSPAPAVPISVSVSSPEEESEPAPATRRPYRRRYQRRDMVAEEA